MTDEEWRGILVVGELNADGRIRRCTLELLAKARELADQLGGRLTCLLVGTDDEEMAETAVHHGADQVLITQADHDGFQAGPMVQPLMRLVQEKQPEIVLLSATDMGRDLAPMLGARLDTGAANECVDLRIDYSERRLLAKRPVYGGQLEETVVIPKARPQIATLRPGAAREGFPDEMRYGSVDTIPFELGEAPKVTGTTEGQPPSLDQAEVVVIGGRGVHAEHWDALEALAETLGGSLGATRGAVHGGRADQERLVDAEGTYIKPRLYLGFGVFGTFEHTLAIQGAEWVVSVHRDAEAPMTKRADWALVGDPVEVARALNGQIRDRRD